MRVFHSQRRHIARPKIDIGRSRIYADETEHRAGTDTLVIKLQNVGLRYGRGRDVLHDVTFHLRPGSFHFLTGPSGAGKSSLLKCLNRTYLASAGTAMYRTAAGEVVDLCSAPERDIVALRREEITYVSQFLKAPPQIGRAHV